MAKGLQGPSGTAGFPAARGRDAARSSLADRAGASEQPGGRAQARPPGLAPALGAAFCASGPSRRFPARGPRLPPGAGALPGRALEETLDSGLVPLCPFRSAH